MIRPLIHFQDKLYLQKKVITDDVKYTSETLDLMNQWLGTNKILRKDNRLYFLEEIEEAEVIAWTFK